MNRSITIIFLLIVVGNVNIFAGGTSEESFFEQDITIEDGREIVNRAEFIRPRRMIYLFDAPASEFSDLDRFLIYNSVLTEIFDANPEVVILESPRADVPPTFEGKQDLARQIDADSWILVSVLGTIPNISFYVETFDLLSLETYGDQTMETGLGLDYRALSRGFWSDLAVAIRDNYEGLIDEMDVTFVAMPGTKISGLSNEQLAVSGEGTITLSLQNPATYTYKAELPGFYTIEEDFYLGYQRLNLDMEQKKAVNWGTELLLNNMQFLGFQGYFFPIPAEFFIKLGFTTYALGFYLIDDSPSIFRSNPMTAIQLHVGLYFGEMAALFRPYAALGGVFRFAHGDDYVGFDQLTPFGISLLGGIEYSLPSRDFRFFVEYNPIMYISQDAIEFRDSSFPMYLYSDNVVPGYVFTETLAFDFRNITMGIRFFW